MALSVPQPTGRLRPRFGAWGFRVYGLGPWVMEFNYKQCRQCVFFVPCVCGWVGVLSDTGGFCKEGLYQDPRTAS